MTPAKAPSAYRHIFSLVLPIVIQNLLSAAVSSADVVMLNYVGQSSISAVSLAAQYASVLFMVFYGLGTGVTILCAQYYGKGDMRAIQVVEGIAMRFSIPIAAAFAAAAIKIMPSVSRMSASMNSITYLRPFFSRVSDDLMEQLKLGKELEDGWDDEQTEPLKLHKSILLDHVVRIKELYRFYGFLFFWD